MKNKKIIFSESEFYRKNSKLFAEELKKLFFKMKINYKKSTVLDFGCGNCMFHQYIKFKKVLLYDIDINYKKATKVKNSKIIRKFQKIKVTKNKFDLVIINSVIQYISSKDLKQILKILIKKINKKGLIIISDIPVHNRLIEFFYDLNLGFFFRAFLYFVKRPKYFGLNFYTYEKEKLLKLLEKNKTKFDVIENLNSFKSRYTLLISKH